MGMAMYGRFSLGATQERLMRVSWVVAQGHALDPSINIEAVRSIGSLWGSWQTWRAWSTDNVICHDRARARELLDRAFQAVCNFYVPRAQYEFLQRPVGVKLYEGDYNMEVDGLEDIVAMHLAGSQSDIVLLLGYDLSPLAAPDDRLERHKLQNRHGLMRGTMVANDQVQWVLVDHPAELDKAYQTLPNLTCDTMANVLQLLV